MREDKIGGFNERLASQAEARKALLEKFKPKPTVKPEVFETRADHLILFLPAGPWVKASNLDRARIRGEEYELDMGPARGFTGRVALTRQSAVDTSPFGPWRGRRIPGLPATQLDARLAWVGTRFGGYGSLFHLGANDLDRYNRDRVPPRTLVALGATWTPHPGLALTLEGLNLGDVRATDVAGFPLPGRSVSVAFETRFSETGRP